MIFFSTDPSLYKYSSGSFEFLFANESATYNGDFHNDKMHGKGTLEWSDGKKYEGEFKNDKR